MGLDMYLNTRRKGAEPKEWGTERLYWRKANQIHAWFVDNVQHGVDECEPHVVSIDKLTELRDLCRKAAETRNDSLLPPRDGFFFGGVAIDDYYWDNLQATADQLTPLIEELQANDQLEAFYQSSW